MRVNDAIIGVIAILVGIIVLMHVQSFPIQEDGHPGPSLFPSVLSVLFILAGLILVRHGLRLKHQVPWLTRLPSLDARGIGNIFVVLLAIMFYSFFSETLGFLITSFVVMFTLMLILRARPLHALPVAVLMTLVIYCIFNKALLVPLPRGLLSF